MSYKLYYRGDLIKLKMKINESFPEAVFEKGEIARIISNHWGKYHTIESLDGKRRSGGIYADDHIEPYKLIGTLLYGDN